MVPRPLSGFLVLLVLLVAAARGEGEVLVTCGSLIKLRHHAKGFNLHSHEVAYGSGSGQQSVTGYKEGEDANDFWVVKGAQGGECQQGSPLTSGARVRLQHAATRRWLHSHHFPSPLTHSQEVSAFGGATESDHLDVWKVSFEKGQSSWVRDGKVKLQHEETKAYLGLSDKVYGRPIAGQAEVCAKGKGDWWTATEGVYYGEVPPDPSETKCATA